MQTRVLCLVVLVGLLCAVMASCRSSTDAAGPVTSPDSTTSSRAPEPRSTMKGDPGAMDEGGLEAEGFREGALAGADDLTEPGDLIRAAERALAPVFFGYDSSALSETALRTLQQNAAWLNAHPDLRVIIAGHCDERGTTEYNLDLGARRARSVLQHLARLGVDASRMETISYGEERPIDPGNNETAWAKNRRAEFSVE